MSKISEWPRLGVVACPRTGCDVPLVIEWHFEFGRPVFEPWEAHQAHAMGVAARTKDVHTSFTPLEEAKIQSALAPDGAAPTSASARPQMFGFWDMTDGLCLFRAQGLDSPSYWAINHLTIERMRALSTPAAATPAIADITEAAERIVRASGVTTGSVVAWGPFATMVVPAGSVSPDRLWTELGDMAVTQHVNMIAAEGIYDAKLFTCDGEVLTEGSVGWAPSKAAKVHYLVIEPQLISFDWRRTDVDVEKWGQVVDSVVSATRRRKPSQMIKGFISDIGRSNIPADDLFPSAEDADGGSVYFAIRTDRMGQEMIIEVAGRRGLVVYCWESNEVFFNEETVQSLFGQSE